MVIVRKVINFLLLTKLLYKPNYIRLVSCASFRRLLTVLPVLTILLLVTLFLRIPSARAIPIYERSPWPAAYSGLDIEKDNTDYKDAAHYCSRAKGRIFYVTHNWGVKLSGISIYVYVPGKEETKFTKEIFRLSAFDYNNQQLITNTSPTYSGVISRGGDASPTFEVYFPIDKNIAGGLPYTFILECLTDNETTIRVEESSRIKDGLTSYYDSTTLSIVPYYMPGRKILYTSFVPRGTPHFPPLTPTPSPTLAPTPLPTPSVTPTPTPVPIGSLFHPVIFVHGLGGSPEAFNGKEDENRNYVKLLTDLGYPENYIHLYSYGYKDDGKGNVYYNYQGDIREIALGMEAVVNSLSTLHKSQGGDGKVDIVAHSLGNLVTRQYLVTHKEDHKVRRYVGVGAPFKGAWIMGVDKGIRSVPVVGSVMEDAIADFFLSSYNKGNNHPLDKDSVASSQVTPDSDYLDGSTGLNKTLISDIDFYAVYGDLNAKVKQKIFTTTFEYKVDVGDGIIQTQSASYTDWTPKYTKLAVNDGLLLNAKIKKMSDSFAFEISTSDIKSVKTLHTDLLSRADSKSKIVCYISSDNTNSCN